MATGRPRTTSVRGFLEGAVALVTMYPDAEAIDPVLKRVSQMLRKAISATRIFSTRSGSSKSALAAGELNGENVPELRHQLAEEYPAQELRMNRELIRVLAYLDDPSTAERVVEQLESDAPMMERLHTALCARFLTFRLDNPPQDGDAQVPGRSPHRSRRT